MSWKEELTKKAVAAETKPAKFGEDIDISRFKKEASDVPQVASIAKLPDNIAENAKSVGINPDENNRSGTFFQLDHSVVLACQKKEIEGVEVLSTTQAINQYDWLKNYYWKAAAVDADKYTSMTELHQNSGYFIRAKSGARLTMPIQACLFIGTQGLIQSVHNIIIAEEGAELHVIAGCTTHPSVSSGMHIGVSEFYVKKGATITFTMIHGWAEDVDVRPRTGAIIEEGGTFISNYICFKPVRSIQMYPTASCIGKDARVRFHSLIYGSKDSLFDVGSRVFLQAEGSRTEMTARVIATDSSRIISRGHIIGEVSETKGHLECRGLLLGNKASIHAIPEIEGKAEGCDLSHEAAVGKIQQAQLCYLMSRGLNEDDATALIIRGFLDPEIPGLPEHLKYEIKRTIEMTSEKVM